MMAKGAWSKLAALCACTVAAAALSSCGAVAKKEPQAQAAATAEDGAVLRAVTVVDGDSLTLEGLRRRPMQRIVPKDAETWAAV